jgi:flagellar protein FlgJ
LKIETYKPIHPKPATDVDTQLRSASDMYEKHFLGEMVKAMKSTVTHTDQPSMAENIYSSQLDKEYVQKWSECGGIGLSDIIYGQLKERFYPDKNIIQMPQGPLPINKEGVKIKIDDTKPMGIPVIKAGAKEGAPELSYLFDVGPGQDRKVSTPWDGQVTQMIRQDDRQLIRLAHENGLNSTISFIGSANEFSRGDQLKAGDSLGSVAAEATGLTWKIENEVG